MFFFHCSIECLTIAHDAGTFLVTVKATIDGVLKSSAVREFLFLVKVMLNIIRIPKRWWLKWRWYSTHYNSLPQVNTVQHIMQETKLIYNSSCFIIPYIVLYPSPSCCFFSLHFMFSNPEKGFVIDYESINTTNKCSNGTKRRKKFIDTHSQIHKIKNKLL